LDVSPLWIGCGVTTARVRNGKVRIPHQYGYRFRIIRFAVVVFCMLFLLHHFYPAFNVPVVPGISCASGVRNTVPDEGVAPAGGIEGGAYATGKALRDLSEGPPNPDDVKDTLLSGAAVAGKFAGGVRAAWDGAAAPLQTPEVEPAPVEGSGTTDVATGGPCSPCGGVNALPAATGVNGIDTAARAALRAGWTGEAAVIAVAVAGPESAYQAGAKNRSSTARGMWQTMMSFHAPKYHGASWADPYANARVAHQIWADAGGWGPWVGYTSGAYRAFMARARAAVARVQPHVSSTASVVFAGNGVAVVDGKRISAIAARQLALAERMSGIDMRIMQGGYGGDHIAASGSSHNYPGVMDVSPGTVAVETVLRRVGFAAWARNIPGRSRAGSGAHVHAVSLLDPGDKTSPQVYGSWAHHGNGLSGSNNDPAAHVAWVSGLSRTGGCGGPSSTPVVAAAAR
jgi:hypothetical protein